jgi:hypothetical protein
LILPCVPHYPWFDLPNDIRGWVQIMKLLTLQLPSFLCYFILGLNILFTTLFSNTLIVCSFLNARYLSFTLIQNNWQNYVFVYFNF